MVMKKIDRIRALIQQQDWNAALRIAARFPRLGNERKAITRAASALLSPAFYDSIGVDVDDVLRQGKEALVKKYLRTE